LRFSSLRTEPRRPTTAQPGDSREPERQGSRKPQTYPILFRGIRLNSYQDPNLRVTLDKSTGIINIAKRAPSVAMYYEENQESREFLTLLSELISDAVFLELAETISKNFGPNAVSGTYSDLKNKYSHLIHKCMQDDSGAGMIEQPSMSNRPAGNRA